MPIYKNRRYSFRGLILLALVASLATATPAQHRSRKQPAKSAQVHEAPVVPPELMKKIDDQGSELKEIKGKIDTVQRSLSDLTAELKQQEAMHLVEKLLELLLVGGGGALIGGWLYRRVTAGV